MILILYDIENKNANEAFRPVFLLISSIPERKTRIKTEYSRLSSYFHKKTTQENRIDSLESLILSYFKGWNRRNGGAPVI